MKRVAWAVSLVALLFVGIASAQYTTKIVREQGGDKLTVLSGGEIEVQSGGVIDLPAGAIARTELEEDALQLHGVSVFDLRQTTGIPLVTSETAGNMNISVSANVMLAQGEITDNETEASVTQFQFALPPSYVAGQEVKIRIPCAIVKTAAATDNGSTVDVSVYWQFGGAVSADLVTTAASTFAAVDQWYVKDFVVTGTNLQPGYMLNVVVTSSIVDSEAGGGTLRFNMEGPSVLADIKG